MRNWSLPALFHTRYMKVVQPSELVRNSYFSEKLKQATEQAIAFQRSYSGACQRFGACFIWNKLTLGLC